MPEPSDTQPQEPAGLPIFGEENPERADAALNRLKILSAAESLFAERGVEAVSMDAVAEAAGVGKGTLYRRFGDRSGLARAILDERDREFQENIIRGEPPLGPGAAPAERLAAFGEGVIDLIDAHGELIVAAQIGRPGARFAGPIYATYRAHVRTLLVEADSQLDADYFADVLLSTLDAEMFAFWREDAGLDRGRMTDAFRLLVERLIDQSPS